MSIAPVISGGVIVEVPKKEYEELIRTKERVSVVERVVAQNDYVNTGDILAILNIKKEERKNEE